MKKKSPRDYATILYDLLKAVPEKKASSAIKSFVEFLARERMLSQASIVAQAFQKLAREREGIRSLALATARPLSAETMESIAKAFGGKVAIESRLDPALVGGFVARTGDERIDASMKGRLKKFTSHLLS